MRTMKHWALAAMAAAALALAGCGGSGSAPPAVVMPPPPTPYETAKAAIMTAETAEAAQALVDGAADDVSGTELISLQAAADARADALAMMARADAQMMALMDAADMIDTSDLSTQALVDAARMAIAGLRQAIADAADVDDVSMYQSQLDAAVMAVDDAQGGIDTDTRRSNQMMALSDASDTLQAALAALSGSTPTQAQLDAANDALTALNDAIAAGADLTDTEKAPYQHEADNAGAPIMTAQMAFDDAEDEADKAAAAAMAVTATKLYAGISDPVGDPASPAATDRAAAYNTDATAIMVSIGDGTNTPTAVSLSEDKMAMIADNEGWEGKRYTRTSPASEGMYEAVVYSNVEAPTQGKKFGSAAAVTPTGAYEYQLTNGELANATTAFVAARVAFTGVTRTAGTETFKLPDPNDVSQTRIRIPGSYHGVSGNYYCTPGTPADGCSAAVASSGFTVSTGDTWFFAPSNAEARVTESADTMYASYGWWIHKAANNGAFTASVFVDERGTVADASGLNDLNGTATYMGGAAGKYSLRGDTGGTNDAGHFTARAMLEANFTTNTAETAISGTIDDFIGADGESRNGSQISDTGAIGNASDSTGVETVWTIDGTDSAADGGWTGNLRNNGDDGVPKVATGTFSATYGDSGNDGKMVGAFGVNKQ